MQALKKISLIITVMLYASCNKPVTYTEENIHIIPKPVSIKINKQCFNFSRNTLFYIKNTDQEKIAETLINKFKKSAGFTISKTKKLPSSNYIEFVTDTTFNKEAYELNVNYSNIKIKASHYAGFLYGIETLIQLLPPEINANKVQKNINWTIPTLEIKDQPRFAHRGLMLDLSRHFFDKEYLLKTIDRLSMLKMNVLHLHLVDDQGWRIEIKKYPKLTEIGAWRVDQEDKDWKTRSTNSIAAKGTYGGYLTQKDLKELVAYAATKNVEIIPEIEMPAHVSSAVAAYPELSCNEKQIAVPSGKVWPNIDIYCPGKEFTFEFLENVLTEVMDIFPSKYIHIGGDEATKTYWKTCPNCKKRIQSENLASVEELQSYMIKRMEKFINSKNKKLIGWDEILEGGLAPEATVMSWRGTKGGLEAAKQGHDVIMTPESHCYLNFYQGPQDQEPQAFDAYTPLSQVYEFDPVVPGMTPEQEKHVLGGQGNLWSEYVTSNKLSEYMLFPRLSALAETLWSPKKLRNWNDFSERIQHQFKRFDFLNINYAKSVYLITSKSKLEENDNRVYLSLQNEFPNSDIRYVLNQDKIDINAKPYHQPIPLENTTVVKASLFKNNKPIGKVYTDTIKFHKAVGSNITFTKPYTKPYTGDTHKSLTNVIRGSKNFHDGQWQAWLTNDMEAVIDLGDEKTIQKVTVGTLESQGAGVYYPTAVKVFVSADGKNYNKVGEIKRSYKENNNRELMDIDINFKETKAKYVKVIAKNLKSAPNGGGTWLFIDEILIN